MKKFCLQKGKIIVIIGCLLAAVCAVRFLYPPVEEIPAGTILIKGDAVENELYLSLDELKSMEDGLVEADYFYVNSYGTKGYCSFKGIWLWYLLSEKAVLKENASRVSFIAEDGYKVEYSLKEVKREDYIDEQNTDTKYKMILAWEENGVEYDLRTGNPFQLVVGQREPGDVNRPYWVRNVQIINIE
ncbi:MAG: molybdopterin-dependent oxidoreductase [Syntrophomonadaceae bacterium]|nr:molybdopterin-dependent oxidoreductase [Syntrophomonadaceae bacterium]